MQEPRITPQVVSTDDEMALVRQSHLPVLLFVTPGVREPTADEHRWSILMHVHVATVDERTLWRAGLAGMTGEVMLLVEGRPHGRERRDILVERRVQRWLLGRPKAALEQFDPLRLLDVAPDATDDDACSAYRQASRSAQTETSKRNATIALHAFRRLVSERTA